LSWILKTTKQVYTNNNIDIKALCLLSLIILGRLTLLLSQLYNKLGEHNAFSQLIPNIDFFIKLHVNKEATSVSRIVGGASRNDEVFINHTISGEQGMHGKVSTLSP